MSHAGPPSSDDRLRATEFVRLLSQVERRLYGYVLSFVMNWQDADEIVQETNVRLWEQFDQFTPGTDFGAWACTIAWYQIRTHRKRSRHATLQFSEQFLEEIAEDVTRVTGDMDERLEALSRCLEKLSDRQRQLIQRCYSGNETMKQVGEHLGQSEAATYQAVSRIRRLLHQCIDRSLRNGA